MKKILVGIMALLAFSACVPQQQQPIEQPVTTQEAQKVIEELLVSAETGIMRYKAMGFNSIPFTFEFPADRQGTFAHGEDALYIENPEQMLQVYDADFFDGFCTDNVRSESFADELGRTWEYDISKPGKGEIEYEIEYCEEPEPSEMDDRTARITVRKEDGTYLATLFFSYSLENEKEALKNFEALLASIRTE